MRQIGEVGHAAQIDDHPVRPRRAESGGVERGHERGAVSSGRHVAAPKVAHDAHTRPLREQCAVHELKGIAAIRPVPDRLSVAPDRSDCGPLVRGPREQRVHGAGAELGMGIGEKRRAVELVMTRRIQGERVGAQVRRVGYRMRRERTPGCALLEVDERGVDAVQARARHEPNVELGHGDRARGYSSSATGPLRSCSSCPESGCVAATKSFMRAWGTGSADGNAIVSGLRTSLPTRNS